MASNDTPSFANTLVSGELSRPWTESQIYETIYENDRPVYETIKALQINNKGRAIEIVVSSSEIYTQLMSTGLQIGNENILFRPYNGVFALLKNVPLEATKEDVLQLAAELNWKISGPAPATRVSPQFYINRSGNNIITGRWICMLDHFPKIKKNQDGTFDFTHKSYGGRIMAFSLSRKRFAATTPTESDPHNYARNLNTNSQTVLNSPLNNSNSSPAAKSHTNSTIGKQTHSAPIHTSQTPSPTKQPTKSVPTTNSLSPVITPLTPGSVQSSSSNHKENTLKTKEKENKLLNHLNNNHHEEVPSKISFQPYHQIKPTPTVDLYITGFNIRNKQHLKSNILELDPSFHNMFNSNHYPDPQICVGSKKKCFVHMLLPQHVAEKILNKRDQYKKRFKYDLSRYKDKKITGLIVKGLHSDTTENDIKEHLQYTHDAHYDRISHIQLSWNSETRSKLLSFHVPTEEVGFYLQPLKIDGQSYSIHAAHQIKQLPPGRHSQKAPPKEKPFLSNRYNGLNFDNHNDTTLKNATKQKTKTKGSQKSKDHEIHSDIDTNFIVQEPTKSTSNIYKNSTLTTPTKPSTTDSDPEQPMENDQSNNNHDNSGTIAEIEVMTPNPQDSAMTTEDTLFNDTDWGKSQMENINFANQSLNPNPTTSHDPTQNQDIDFESHINPPLQLLPKNIEATASPPQLTEDVPGIQPTNDAHKSNSDHPKDELHKDSQSLSLPEPVVMQTNETVSTASNLPATTTSSPSSSSPSPISSTPNSSSIHKSDNEEKHEESPSTNPPFLSSSSSNHNPNQADDILTQTNTHETMTEDIRIIAESPQKALTTLQNSTSNESSSEEEEPIRIFPTPDSTEQHKPMMVNIGVLRDKRKHQPQGDTTDDEKRGRAKTRRKHIRGSHSLESDSTRESSPSPIPNDKTRHKSKPPTTSRSKTPLKSKTKKTTKPISVTNFSPTRQRSPHTANIPTPALNQINSPPGEDTPEGFIYITYNGFIFQINPSGDKDNSHNLHEKECISSKTLLQKIIATDYDFLTRHDDTNCAPLYTPQDYEKLTGLLLFYEIGQAEELVDGWPTTLPSLPYRVEFSWRHFCRQFKTRNSTYPFSEGPGDMDKYLGIAKDLVQPAHFDTNALRATARDAVRKDAKSSKIKQKSSPKL